MAKPTSQITLGIDVSKDELVHCDFAHADDINRIDNEPKAIRAWLRSFHGPVRIAVEPTSTYHLACVDEALKLGHEVYLINPRQLVHYREAVNERNKTDPNDAFLLARYLDREIDQLRPFKPQCRKAQRLWALMKRRGVVAQARQQLKQSLKGVQLPCQALFRHIDTVLKRIDQRMTQLIRELGWWADFKRCLSIPGIGTLNAVALTATYHRGAFSSANAFIAFIGLDVRIRESGRFKGKRKLTKRGESEPRRLLYCAAKPARSYLPFASFHQQQLDKGLPKIAANVILARKLARIAFALMRNEQEFIKTTT